MIALIGTVFVASLAGSVHCAGMCGGIAAACAGCSGGASAPAPWRGTIAYHAARGAAYAALGAAAGVAGAALDLGGRLMGLQRAAAIFAGAVVVLAGVAMLLRQGGFPAAPAVPRWLQRSLGAGHRWAALRSPVPRAVSLGALSALLPCGWLWAFLAVAAGAGSPVGGAAVMAAFWAGSVPILVFVAVGVRRASGLWRGRVAALASAAMIAVGVHTMVTAGTRSDAVHRAAWQPASDLAAASHRVEEAQDETPACCRGEPEIEP